MSLSSRIVSSIVSCSVVVVSYPRLLAFEYCITCVGRNKITYRGSRLVIPVCLHDGRHVGVLVCIVVLLSKSISIETGGVYVGKQRIPYRLIGHVVSVRSPSGRHVAVAVAPARLSSGSVGHVLRCCLWKDPISCCRSKTFPLFRNRGDRATSVGC